MPKITVLYHYFSPDDVVSARLLSDFCVELTKRGWSVEAIPSNRRYASATPPLHLREHWEGIDIRRVWRPGLNQSKTLGRLGNAAWMLTAWSALALRKAADQPDVLLVGTDPILSVSVASAFRQLQPRVATAHWCFDMYPEAAIADGLLAPHGTVADLLMHIARIGYQSCDLIADIGVCMQGQLKAYASRARHVTLVPWALAETDTPAAQDPHVRKELFGEASIGLLYSGSFGRAHSYQSFLNLARAMRADDVAFCFAVRGNRAEELRRAVSEADHNIRFASFASEADLLPRLGAADIHLASLRPEWTGLVVPSKFFGSLAAGRPVLFAGSPQSAIAHWLAEHKVGWLLGDDNAIDIATALRHLIRDRSALFELHKHCHATYTRHFSKRIVMDQWDAELRALIRR